jgi:opacity protein-like surface antigen
MLRKSLSIILVAIILLHNSIALSKDFYITIPITISNIASVKEKNHSENFNLTHESVISPIFGVGLGYYINSNSRVELLFESLNLLFNDQTGNFNFLEDEVYTIGTKSVKRKVFGKSIKCNYYYNILHKDSFQIFIGAGIGGVQVKENKSFLVSGHFIDAGDLRSFPSVIKNARSAKTTNFTYSLMVGTSKNFNSIGHFDLTYSWRDYGKIKNNGVSNRYKGHHFSAGVRFDL